MARVSGLTRPGGGRSVVSLLDVDFYKFTMGQFVLRRYPGVRVRYRLICRTPGANLPEAAPSAALRDELDAIRGLSFRPGELAYLRGLEPRGRFGEDFLSFLARLRLPPVTVAAEGRRLRVETEGRWPEVILWETLILSALSERISRATLARDGGAGAFREALELGRERLERKVHALRARPGLRFASFGTRRRFSRSWQLELEARLARALPDQFTGTSCVASARENGIAPVGTIAHEIFMVGAAASGGDDDSIRASQRFMVDAWWDEYGEPLSVFLTDTWTTPVFLADVDADRARRFRGVRHDSGDPAAFGDAVLDWYGGHGVDPRAKSLVFSDGLEAGEILDLHDRFGGRIRVAFGWGTNLTNDCGVPNLSLVVKPIAANGRPLVKLSDNPGKTTGRSAEVARYRRIFAAPAGPTTLPVY